MPVSINLLPDEVIARGITGADWGKGIEGYFAGQDLAQKQALQNLFRGGLPRTPEGGIDYAAAGEQVLRLSGAAGLPLVNQLRELELQERRQRGFEAMAPSIFGPVPQAAPPSPAPTSAVEPDVTPGPTAARPTPANLVQPNETAFKVDYGPITTSYASGREETQPDTRYPPQFSQTPVTGPPSGQFTPVSQVTREPPPELPPSIQRTTPTQVAQAQAPRQQPEQRPAPPPAPDAPLVPPGAPGFFTEQNAQNYERAAGRANFGAAWVGEGKGGAAQSQAFKNQADQLANTAKLIREQIGKVEEKRTEHGLKLGEAMPLAAAKANIDRLEKSKDRADSSADSVSTTQEMFNQLNSRSGIFSGAWATQKLRWAQIAQTLGYPIDVDRVANTQTFMALIGKEVAAEVKAFGTGAGITEKDVQFTKDMVGGNIELNEESIRNILEINDKLKRSKIKKHNADVERVIKVNPSARPHLEAFKVEVPAPLSGRTTQQPAPPIDQRQVGQVYQTPRGLMRWQADGWYPVQ